MKTRPDHTGNWMTVYDGREKMNAAQRAALTDAAAAEVDGWPTAEMAAEWLAAMKYRFDATGGGLALMNARPPMKEGLAMARKTLVAAAYLARSMTNDTHFRQYIPLNSVGYFYHHELLKAAYNSPSDTVDHAPSEEARQKWATYVTALMERLRSQYSNGDWVWDAATVLENALGNFTNARSA